MVLIDSHCHIQLLGKDINIDEVINNAVAADVKHMLCVSVDLETYPKIQQLAQQYPCIYTSVGIHPNTDTPTCVPSEKLIEKLTDMAVDNHVLAIGETGLDYLREETDIICQQQRFRDHIQSAKIINKPLIIHTREAKEDVLNILTEEGADNVGGVMHCFVEDWDTAQKAMDMNFYISFSGIVTFKNAKEIQEVAKKVPLDRMLIETDSPYLAPVPLRGKPNRPAYVRYVAEFIAQLRDTSIEHIAGQTTENFARLFKIKCH